MWWENVYTILQQIYSGNYVPNFITIAEFYRKYYKTRNSSGDEIANVNFLYDDIVHALKIQ